MLLVDMMPQIAVVLFHYEKETHISTKTIWRHKRLVLSYQFVLPSTRKKNDCLVLAYGILQVCITLNFSLTLWWFQKFHEAICKNLKKSQEISSSRHLEHFIPGKSVCKTLFQVLICRQCDAWRTGKSTFHVWILKQAWIDSSWQGVWIERHWLVKLRDAVNKCDVCFNHIWMGWQMASRPLALSPWT